MLVPVEWLKEYTDIPVDAETFCARMVMSGSNIETVEKTGENIEEVVVGRVLSIEKHPDADKLVVCRVDAGQERPLQVVTGAPNVSEGALIPVALHGSRLPDGTVIKKGKLRGVESEGMFCSFRELGYEDKVVPVVFRDGVWILEEDAVPGTEIVEAMGLADTAVDFEITPNRPDCLSMLGMAREAAATLGTELRYPETVCRAVRGKAEDYLSVEIRKPELCRRYVARIVTNVKIEQSPWWLQRRLMHAGMRPINNIVDITNYVMLEYGQPIHAFDIRNVLDRKIIVDTAGEGELFTTLDGTERRLSEGMLLIKDGRRGVALAGVMGGLNSEIEADTDTILIESANFDGASVRSTSKKLGLRTEASARFEKGIDPNLAAAAADRVCKLIELLGAGTVAAGAVDCYPEPRKASPVLVRPARANSLLGIELTTKEMEAIFRSLEMETLREEGQLLVTPPTVRQDLETEIDFIEEIARLYGYDKLPVTLPKDHCRSGKPLRRQLRDLARDTLAGLGLDEIQTYSFFSPKSVESMGVPAEAEERKLVRLLNPLGDENSVMRTLLLPNLLETMGRNYSRSIEEVRLFELGNTFFDIPGEEGLPQERESLSIGLYGGQGDFFTLKGIVEALLKKLGVGDAVFRAETEIPAYHPGRCASVSCRGMLLGYIGELHPDMAEKYGMDLRVCCGELSFGKLAECVDLRKAYKPLPKYPAVSRDVALLVDEEICAGSLGEAISAAAGPLLEKTELFDVYRGKQVPEGKKSVAFALTYRAPDRTLTD
ncbi:MAG: phenylalanine--tRNA ligase subunit beta, partial [Bacillota bacterium]|nr:phenylalanine--tRNA ligase subunit beta [Bacillota bacterium]